MPTAQIGCSPVDDQHLLQKGVFFLPWIGHDYTTGYCGRRTLVVGESHYTDWKDTSHDTDVTRHELKHEITRECINDYLINPGDAARLWGNIEKSFLGIDGDQDRLSENLEPIGNDALWRKIAFYNFVQTPILGGADIRPTPDQFRASRPAFKILLNALNPDCAIIFGRTMWKYRDATTGFKHEFLQSYKLESGKEVWCLNLWHASWRFYSWKVAHPLITKFFEGYDSVVESL
jgi:hypothetical protein